MTRVNLIPPEIHAAALQRQIQTLGMALGGVVVAVLIGFWALRLKEVGRIRVELEQANADLAKYQAIVDKVNALEQTRNQLKSRSDLIKQLLKGRLIYPKLFEDLMSLMPGEIWLTGLTTTFVEASGEVSVSMNAQSLSNFAIIDWMTNLQGASVQYRDIRLGAITVVETPNSRGSMLNFTLGFQYSRSDS